MKTKISGTKTRSTSWTTQALRRMAKSWCGAAAILPFLAATPVSAQQPGDTVRISGEVVGVVVEADSAGLRLSAGYAPYAGMRSLELWGGTTTQAVRGFKYGFIAGGIVGAAVGMAFCALGCSDPLVVVGAVWGGMAGLVVGWIGSVIGSTIKSDVWTPVPIPGGLSLRLAVGGT